MIDDNPAIHDDIRKILLGPNLNDDVHAARAELFGTSETQPPCVEFHIDCAEQGRQGFEMVQDAIKHGHPYAMAFVDMRMPPGWDGAETIEHIWQVDPDIQIVICTAYSDHDWEDLLTRLTHHDKLLILQKPFEAIEVKQLATSLTERWNQQIHTKQQLERIAALQEERAWEVQQVIRELEKEANRQEDVPTIEGDENRTY